MIKWDDSFSTGIDKIDQQHKDIFKYCNDLEESLKIGGISRSVLERALFFLGNYTKDHFGQEEACMHKYACPFAEINLFAHQEFLQKYIIFEKGISEGEDLEGMMKELHHFLESWLKEHICKIDVHLKKCVHK